MPQPLISIIVPCYNQAKYLQECLQSVLDQTYHKWECIIVNDGSPDSTEEVAKRWAAKDSRFKYFYKENGGLSSARNIGLKHALGDWIQFLDSDDIILKDKFERSLMSAKDHNLIVCNFNLLEEKKTILPPFCDLSKYSINRTSIITQWDIDLNIPIHAALIRRDLLADIKFDENLATKEDWDFWLTIFQKTVHIQYIDEHLVYYRINPNSVGKNMMLTIDTFKKIYEKANDDDDLKSNIFNRVAAIATQSTEEKDFFKRSYNSIHNMRIVKAYLKLRNLFK